MGCDEKKRLIIKQGAGIPTVPVSADHRNGDWLDTDIYEGELYMDTDSGVIYSRDSTGISVNGAAVNYRYKIVMSQTGAGAPTVDSTSINNMGAISLVRVGAGDYETRSGAIFTANKTYVKIGTGRTTGEEVFAFRKTTSVVSIKTYSGGAPSDGILNETYFEIQVDL